MKRLQLVIGSVLVGLVVLAALVSVFWTPFDPIRVVPEDRLLGPGWPHLLGTDGFGIDIASQLLVGARMCLLVGIISVSLAAVFGVPLWNGGSGAYSIPSWISWAARSPRSNAASFNAPSIPAVTPAALRCLPSSTTLSSTGIAPK